MNKLIKKPLSALKKKLSVKKPVRCPVYDGALLTGRTAFITGGSSGIGYSIAERFLKNGANVIVCGRNKDKLGSAVAKLKKNADISQTVQGVILDVSDVDHVSEKLSAILDAQDVDILVNNAGIDAGERIGGTSVKDFERVIRTNLEGPYFLAQTFLNYMRKNKKGGNMLFIASSSSLRPAHSPYIVSKWGIAGLIKGLAKVGIRDGIVVNGIAPGPTATPMLGKEDGSDISHDSNPSGRFAMPEEIANLATILVSDLGKMIVGDIVFATGGAGVVTFDDIEY